jgi:hypothetical protein
MSWSNTRTGSVIAQGWFGLLCFDLHNGSGIMANSMSCRGDIWRGLWSSLWSSLFANVIVFRLKQASYGRLAASSEGQLSVRTHTAELFDEHGRR